MDSRLEHGWLDGSTCRAEYEQHVAPAGSFYCDGCDDYCEGTPGKVFRDCGGWVSERYCESCAERMFGDSDET